jgi:hypothetical protein
MLHLLPQFEPRSQPLAYAEAVSRLASIRHALRLVDGFGGGPASDLSPDEAIAAAWPEAGEGKRRNFDRRSAQLVGATAAGVEALLDQRREGTVPHFEASQALVKQIRRELQEIAGIILG